MCQKKQLHHVSYIFKNTFSLGGADFPRLLAARIGQPKDPPTKVLPKISTEWRQARRGLRQRVAAVGLPVVAECTLQFHQRIMKDHFPQTMSLQTRTSIEDCQCQNRMLGRREVRFSGTMCWARTSTQHNSTKCYFD